LTAAAAQIGGRHVMNRPKKITAEQQRAAGAQLGVTAAARSSGQEDVCL
jgi:hypothetical protein